LHLGADNSVQQGYCILLTVLFSEAIREKAQAQFKRKAVRCDEVITPEGTALPGFLLLRGIFLYDKVTRMFSPACRRRNE